ncbi:FliM/FliN family flagellar motor switch protein [Aureimonas sp. ME7]|uniref:FliM/FliN family flagellar motor switch protein n=1 Tax=Aureimonas sp. ME7 TaxID=2744252 RepID=UPI0015F3B946|nr:FliM/FliN family flagellar motor switch protein [Aureimonas sp. ME7]
MDTITERNIGERLRSAARIEPERLPRLKLVGMQWAEAVAAKLSATHASPLAIEFVASSHFELSAGAIASSDTQLALTVRSPKWRETALVMADGRFADTVTEAAFGGDGRNPPATPKPLSQVGRFFADAALRAFIDAGNTAFTELLPLAMSPDRLATDEIGEKLEEWVAPDARSFIEFRFRVSIGGCEAALRVALPEVVLAPHRRKLAAPVDDGPSIVDESWARDLEAGFQKTDMHVRAILGEQQTTLGAISTFQVGQTIALDATMQSLILLECEGQRLFRGHMGRSRDAYVIKVEEPVDPTEEFIDDILAH